MSEAMIIAAHAGTGKTMLGLKYKNVLDLESTDFKWIYPEHIKVMPKEQRKSVKERVLNPQWPQNYIDAIDENRKQYDIILIMSNPPFLDYLDSIHFEYKLVYPTVESKTIYMTRYKERGNNQNWLQRIEIDFENLIEKYKQKNVEKMILQNDETLEDCLLKNGHILIRNEEYKC